MQLHDCRHREREHAPALLGGAVGCFELGAVRVAAAPDHEDVPVQRSVRLDRHGGHQIQLRLAEPLAPAVEDAGQRGPRMATGLGAEGVELLRVARRKSHAQALAGEQAR